MGNSRTDIMGVRMDMPVHAVMGPNERAYRKMLGESSQNSSGIMGLILDMDGVVADTQDMCVAGWNAVLSKYGKKLDDEDIKVAQGRSFRDTIQGWNDKYGIVVNFDEAKRINWGTQRELLHTLKASPGLVEMLKDVTGKGMPVALGTSSIRERAEAIVKAVGVGDYFSAMACAEDVERHKPYPDIFIEAARRIGVQPVNCAVVEDASNGIAAAKFAEMYAIGYLNGRNELADLIKSDMIVKHLDNLNYERIRRLRR